MKLYRNPLIVKEVEEHVFSRQGRRGKRGTHNIYTRIYAYMRVRERRSAGSRLQAGRIGRRSFLQNARRVKAGTFLDPFLGFYLPVTVQVRTEVAMPAKPGAGIILQQQHDKHTQRMLLERGPRVGGTPASVEPALIADAD